MTPKPKSRMCQSIVIGFDDGSEATFFGPAVCFLGDKRKILVDKIRFTEPKELPKGCEFEKFEEAK